jgi:proline dehydrogenase
MLHKLLIGTLPLLPRPVMRHFAGKYIAGETLEQELAKLREMAGRGFSGVLDILGEGSSSESHAREAAEAYIQGAEAVAEAQLDTYVSIKPTHLGLNKSEALALELFGLVAARCRDLGVFMRIEMEDHPTTDATLRIYEALRPEYERVGIVLQARLHRTLVDIENLAPGPVDVRMVKGIYLEPAEIAHTDPSSIRRAYLDCTRRLLTRGDVHLRLATHDEGMANDLIELMADFEVPREDYEFQVLLGVQEQLWERWKLEGLNVRVYVPFGPEWREYSQRRLRKNPELFKAVMRQMLPA